LLLSGCSKEAPTTPEVEILTGESEYSLVATNPTDCPVVPVQVGCNGGGILEFVPVDDSVECTYKWVGGCQTCGWAGDMASWGPLDDFRISGRELSFSISPCRYTGVLPEGPVAEITGEVTC
jgi:hypothetical protein